MWTRTWATVLGAVLIAAAGAAAGERDALTLARAGRYRDLAAIGGPAVAPLLAAYGPGDRETRSAVLRALGALGIKSAPAVDVLATDVDGEDSAFQDLHRYALQAVDPDVRSTDLFVQVAGERVALDPELARGMYATLTAAYGDCADKLAHARRYVEGLSAAAPQARYAAIVSLRIMTGATHAYHPWADDAARAPALAGWRAWLHGLERACRE